jgi:hypothetical protein
MSGVTTFDSTKQYLSELLRDIACGETQLPDFQRGWVWDDEHVRSLIASVSLSYPIGAVMMLQTGNPDVRFKPRLIEGVSLLSPPEPDQLILDGQQRLTSLFQALFMGQPVITRYLRGNPIRRWYYVSMTDALDPNADRDDAIVGLPEDLIVKNFRGEVVSDYSTPDREYEKHLFPLSQVFHCAEWRSAHNRNWKYDPIKTKLFDDFENEFIKRFERYQIPVIILHKETPKEAVCQVFEKVNTGGVSLTVFELLTATYAVDDFNLRDDWKIRQERLKQQPVLRSLESTDFLQAITLLATNQRRMDALNNGVSPDRSPGVSCKRKDVLRLTLSEYKQWADSVTDGFEKSARLLRAQKIFTSRDLPYRTQLTPLAAIFAMLGANGDNDGVKNKIAQWYWCGVFGELYGGAIETRFAKDLPEVLGWIATGQQEPDTVRDANFSSSRLYSLRTRNSAAYKGLYALLIRDGCLDFRTGDAIDSQIYFDERIDIHHIFPKKWCQDNNINSRFYDSIVNKTAISARTNRMIGSNSPSIYLNRLQTNAAIDTDRMDEILKSHVIDPALLRANDFEGLLRHREDALLTRIEKAMGKTIARNLPYTESQDNDIGYAEEEDDAT